MVLKARLGRECCISRGGSGLKVKVYRPRTKSQCYNET